MEVAAQHAAEASTAASRDGDAAVDRGAAAVTLIGSAREPIFPLAGRLLIMLWIGIEAAGLAVFFWLTGQAEEARGPVGAHAAAMAVCVASVPATLMLWLVWLFCGPLDRRGRQAAGAMALLALTVWAGLDQLAASTAPQTVWLFFQPAWQIGVAVTALPLLLVWWLWGVAVVVFFYRYFGRGRITRDALAEEVSLRSSRLLVITLLVSITAGGSRFWARMLPIDWPEALLITAVMFGFGICAGLCFLCLTIGLMQSWWGYGGLLMAIVATGAYSGTVRTFFGKTITTEWIAVVLAALAAILFHGAVFLLPLRAAGYRLRGVR